MSIGIEASTNVYCGHRPVRLAALMELYERNFLMVEQLVPELDLPFDSAVSRSASDLPLHLTTLERSRYTCAFRLTYVFADDGQDAQVPQHGRDAVSVAAKRGTRCDPDLQLRVYRDAHVVEALRCVTRPPWQAEGEGDPQVERFLSAQWSRNLLLYKWLVYLLGHGHGFGMAGRPRERALSATNQSSA